MNEQEQRIAIAEACGWADIRLHPHIVDGWPDILGGFCPRLKCRQSVPDYLHDLNAMHDVLRTLEPNDQVFFIACLWTVLGLHTEEFAQEARGNDYYFRVLCATAAQLAEAFLRLKSKCKD